MFVTAPTDICDKFQFKAFCQDANKVAGECEAVSLAFIALARQHNLQGRLLCIGTPRQNPVNAEWYGIEGKDPRHDYAARQAITHYVAYFPEHNLAVDWSAKQFWPDKPAPWLLSLEELQQVWEDTPLKDVTGLGGHSAKGCHRFGRTLR